MKYTSTTERAPIAGREHAARQTRVAVWLLPLVVALAALLPRGLGLADFLTTDEAYHWITRTERFAAAIGEGRWADTLLTGHPGVTLMWLGSFGLQLERLAVSMGWAVAPDRLGHLAWLRLGPVLAHTLAITAGYLLLRRLVRPGVALVAALLWATSPFLVAFGRVLHLDALLTNLCMLTLLAAMVACRSPRSWPWLLLTGLCCGLALLTKGPALIVLPVLGLTMFALSPTATGERLSPAGLWSSFPQRLGWAVPRYLLVLAVAAVVVVALWPALWATPERAIARYVGEIVGNGGRPNGDGQFFLGSANADPGPFFYPLAGLYRLTPVELLGLLVLPLAFWRWTRACSLDPATRCEQATLLILGAFALFWVAVMTAGPKKFDRYILPMWPALLVLAAYGLVALYERFMQNAKVKMQSYRMRFTIVHAACCILLLQGALLAWYHPYYLSYYNPLLGGGPVAQRLFLIGWGEGMDKVGAWLRAQPDITGGQVLSALPPTLQPFVPVPVQEVRALATTPANYAVVYLESLQRGDAPELYAQIQETLPLHTVTIHGITYAQIHQLTRPYSTPVGAEFGGALRLRGFTAVQEGARLVVTPSWDVRATPPGDLMLFLHLYDQFGIRVTGIDVPPGGASLPTTGSWQPGAQVAVPLPIDLPPDLPAGTYTLTLGLYDPATGARQALTAGPAADPRLAGPAAALLGSVTVGP